MKTQKKPRRKHVLAPTAPAPENRRETGASFGLTVPPEVGKATQFKPGVSGNPGGRPRTHGLLQVLRAAVDVVDPDDGRTIEEKLIAVLIEEALEGRNRLPAIAEILNRLEGRSAQQIDINNVTKDPRTPQERITALLKLSESKQ